MLAIEQLSFRYREAEQAALCEVSLQVNRGEVFGLLGPNGAGKTTLISHLAGLARIQQGSITVDGETLAAVRRRDPTRIAIAPQEYAFYPMLTVLENLRCFAGACSAGISAAGAAAGDSACKKTGPTPLAGPSAAIERCLAFAQLDAWRNVRAERLSGGLKRRLNLAIALLPAPELVLLDEPTVGVDPQSRAFLLDVVKQLARDGAAVIYTSHYMEEIEAIADRVAILDHGRVLRCGTLDELLNEGGGQRLELTVDGGATAELTERLAPFGTVEWHGARACLDLAAGQTPLAILNTLAAAGLPVEHVSFGRNTLEHLFMRLTHRSLRDH
jgi:ABC-2 type transport system ATP-binding protein